MVEFYYANDGKHKLIAKFNNPNEIIKFGAYDYNDYKHIMKWILN